VGAADSHDCAETAITSPSTSPTVAMSYPPPRVHAFFKSFVYAYFGILEVLATQRNMVVHCIIAIPTLLATQLLDFTAIENVIILFCVALVLACEIVNTSIENLCNVVSPEFRPAIRRSKDAAAAMVLISAIAAAAVGVILFTSQRRPERLMRWDIKWEWGGSIDNVMVKLVFLGICWLFVHAWVYRRNTVRTDDKTISAAPKPPSSCPPRP
jgi:diacylglycerol kinase